MSAARGIGGVLLILSVPVFLAALLVLFSSESPIPLVLGDNTGYALAGLGAFFLVLGLVMLVFSPRKKAAQSQLPAAVPVQEVVIKRTEMNWGSTAAKSPTEELQTELDTINKKIGQAKVRYGVGELSGETYKLLIEEYEKEKAAIQKRIIDQER